MTRKASRQLSTRLDPVEQKCRESSVGSTASLLAGLSRRAVVRIGAAGLVGGGLLATVGTSPGTGERRQLPARQVDGTPEPLPPPTTGSRTATLATELRNPAFDDGHVRYLIEALARSGIATYADATGGAPLRVVREPASPLALTRWQVRNLALELATSSGRPGADLDRALPVPTGTPPLSFLLAGYVATADTLGGAFCRGLLADQELTRPGDVVFPGVVLVFFASELAIEVSGETAGVAGPGRAANARRALLLPPAQGTCSAVESFISQTLEALFDALKVEVPDDVPGLILASLWNFAVAIAEGIVTGLGELLTGPVIQAIRAIAGAVAVVSQIASFLTPWYVSASPSFGKTRFAVGGEPDIAGSITFMVDGGGLDEWPADVAECAGGAPLPPLSPEPGTAVTLQLVESPIDLVTEGGVPTALDGDARAVIQYVTNRETSDEGPVQTGTFLVKFTLERKGLEGLGEVLAGVLLAALPTIVTEPLVQLLGAQIDALVQTLDTMTEVVGTSLITVTYHEQVEPTPTIESETPETAGGLACPVGEWTALNFQECLQAILSPAQIAVTEVEGVLTYDFAPGGDLTIEPALLIFCEANASGTAVDVIVTMVGPVTGTWQDQGETLAITTDVRALLVTYDVIVDGVPLGGQAVDFGLDGFFGGATTPYECGTDTLSLNVPNGVIPLVLGR
jgi:hypothetical protein